MNFELRNLFPTPLWVFDLDSMEPNLKSMVEMDGIVTAVKSIKEN